jgi:CRP-like cAMP-binding protein
MPKPYHPDELHLPADSEIYALLKQCPDIACVKFLDGEYIIREHELGTDIFLVLKGSYVVEQSSPGPHKQRATILAINTGETDTPSFVGEMAYFGSCPRTASVRSSGASHTCCLKPDHLDIILEHYPLLTRIICRQFTERLKNANEQLRSLQEERSMVVEQLFLNPGDILFKQGQSANKLYQLVDGVLRRLETNEQITIRTGYEGFIDPGPFFRGECYSTTVKAETPALLIAIDAVSTLAAIRNFPELIVKALKIK